MASNLKIKVQADTASAKTSISNLESQLSKVKSGSVLAGSSGVSGFLATGAAITAAVVVAKKLAEGIGECISTSNDLNKSMAAVATLIPKSTDRVNELKDGVLDLGTETGKSFEDLSQGTYQVISAFGDSVDTMTYLTIAANGATAGMSTTEQMINLTSAAMKGFGDISTEAAQHTSDLAFQTVKLGQTTIPELSTAIMKVTDNSASLGITEEEMFTTFATLTGVIGGAAEVSTKFAATQKALLSPTDSLNKMYETMGIESSEAMVAQYGWADSMKLINNYATKAGIPLSDLVGSAEAMNYVASVGGRQYDTYNKKQKEMGEAAGSTNEALTEVKTGVNKLGYEIDQNKAKWEKLKVKIGDDFNPVAELTVGWLGDILTGLNDDDSAMGDMKTSTDKLITSSSNYSKILKDLTGDINEQTKAALELTKAQTEMSMKNSLNDFSDSYGDNQDLKVTYEADVESSQKSMDAVFANLKRSANGYKVDYSPDISFGELLSKMNEISPKLAEIANDDYSRAMGKNDVATDKLSLLLKEEAVTMGTLSTEVADGTLNIDALQFSNKDLYDTFIANADAIDKQREAQKKLDLETPEGHSDTGASPVNGGSLSTPAADDDDEVIIKNNDIAIAQYKLINDLLNAKTELEKNEINRKAELAQYTEDETGAIEAVNTLYNTKAQIIKDNVEVEEAEEVIYSNIKSFLEENNELLSDESKKKAEIEAIDEKILNTQHLLLDSKGDEKEKLKEIVATLYEEKSALEKVVTTASDTSWADDIMSAIDPNGSAKEFEDAWTDTFGSLSDTFGDYAKDIMSGISAIEDAQLDADQSILDNETNTWNKRKSELQEGVNDEEEASDDVVDAWKDQYSAGAISYDEYLANKTEAKLEHNALKDAMDEEAKVKEAEQLAEQNRIDKKKFDSDQKNAIAQIWMDTAVAVVKGYSQLGFWGGSAFALAMGTTAGFQTSAVNKQEFVPALAEGGIATKPTMALIGEGGEPEMVLPLSKAKNFGFGGDSSSSGNIIINMNGSTYSTSDEVYAAIYKGISKAQNIGRIKQW
jgi:TP901 family phage tail tape measure protein